MSDLFRAIAIWRHLGAKKSVRYTCMENISLGGFCVLAADYFYLPLDRSIADWQDLNLIELLTEDDLSGRVKWLPTLKDAIQRHDGDFGNP